MGESKESPANNSNPAMTWRTNVFTAKSTQAAQNRDGEGPPAKRNEARQWWKFHLRPFDDTGETDWWFASTAIPLLAATLGPLANVLSLAALVTYWRMSLLDEEGNTLPELQGIPFKDPHWCYGLNVASLTLGFVGNVFLLFNFTNRIRYIIALPMTIFLWYFATGILIAITVCMEVYVPPIRPSQTYTQGFWYAVIAAVLYLICSMLLMINMLGYFLGHYPQHFTLTDHQRTLILQTMLFFIWLAGGGAVFSRIESKYGGPGNGWSFVDGLYFCDVTILTVGFGDLYPHDNMGRGLVFPYSVGGIIMLGLVISSIHNFAAEIAQDKFVTKHVERIRVRTIGRAVTSSTELKRRVDALPPGKRPKISGPYEARNMARRPSAGGDRDVDWDLPAPLLEKRSTLQKITSRKPKLLLLREEKDRFDAMRRIQKSTATFKRWWALTLSICAFGILWCVGAVVFWQAEKGTQGMTYFQALYFCYVSLLTIGYGDLSPRSNAGRCFFVVWSLVAVPTMTILISDMGDTIISKFKYGTFRLADFTVLPKEGIWRNFLEAHPWLLAWLQDKSARRAAKKRRRRGMPVGPADGSGSSSDEQLPPPPNLEELAKEAEAEETGALPDEDELARRLALAIRRTANDLKLEHPRKYSYEEWVEYTKLIRFTARDPAEVEREEEEEGLIQWDWIGEDSPMMAQKTEPEFVLDRLCESLVRFIAKKGEKKSGQGEGARDERREAQAEELREETSSITPVYDEKKS